ncbi:MAG: copper chaperone PCu(A)C [Novosphingobium sp.]|nr:copper chaperone PCu(A)C [Novosphingobium sp.]
MRRRTFGAILAGALSATGCGGEAPAPAPTETAEATAENAPGVALSDARVQLPVVSGRPGVAYFTLSQANGAPRKLVGVAVDLAGRAEMHETSGGSMKPVSEVALESGKAVKFEPGGLHVMLFELDPKLRFQKEVDLTITLDTGDKASAKAPVATVAEAMEQAR